MNIIEVRDLKKYFYKKSGVLYKLFGMGPQVVQAVSKVSFNIEKGNTMALVGESGCGKTTVARLILNLIEKEAGQIYFKGKALEEMNVDEYQDYRENAAFIAQDFRSSLNPRKLVGEILAEPFRIHPDVIKKEKEETRIKKIVNLVGLNEEALLKFPHEFSGGQARRIGVARALMLNPEFIVCDEPTSGLDLSISAAIINLMKELKEEFDLTYLWISHNLNVVRYISDYVGVMYLGRIIEIGKTQKLFNNPSHPYSEALIESVPSFSKEKKKIKRKTLEGEVPSPIDPPLGCPFHPRCKYSQAICEEEVPILENKQGDRVVACHFPL
ncbi:MAG TPA: ABC transporter ATP-binding protein [Halanaerobiales bacterium]|nr:ABC transporter ATP-binding protein [Halanaerobiales bacterium]